MKRTTLLLIFSILIMATLISGSMNEAIGSPNTIYVYLDPPEYVFPAGTPVGTKFNVTVWVNSTEYPFWLMMFQVYITFNDTLINVTQIWGDITSDWTYRAWPNDNLEGRNWDDNYVFKGKSGGAIGNPVYYPANMTGAGEPASLVLGDLISANTSIAAPMKLCAIEFEIKATPPEGQEYTSLLQIDNVDTYLYTYAGPIEDVVKVNGQYTILPEFSIALLLIFTLATASAAVLLKKSYATRKTKKA